MTHINEFYVGEDDEDDENNVFYGHYTLTRVSHVRSFNADIVQKYSPCNCKNKYSHCSCKNCYVPRPCKDDKEYEDIVALIEMKREDRYRMAQESGDPVGFYNKYIKAKKKFYSSSKTKNQHPKVYEVKFFGFDDVIREEYSL